MVRFTPRAGSPPQQWNGFGTTHDRWPDVTSAENQFQLMHISCWIGVLYNSIGWQVLSKSAPTICIDLKCGGAHSPRPPAHSDESSLSVTRYLHNSQRSTLNQLLIDATARCLRSSNDPTRAPAPEEFGFVHFTAKSECDLSIVLADGFLCYNSIPAAVKNKQALYKQFYWVSTSANPRLVLPLRYQL